MSHRTSPILPVALSLLVVAAYAADAGPTATVRAASRALPMTEADTLYARALFAAAGNALSAQHQRYQRVRDDGAHRAEVTSDLIDAARRLDGAGRALAMVSPASGPSPERALRLAICQQSGSDRYGCTSMPQEFSLPAILCYDPAQASSLDPFTGVPFLPAALSQKMVLVQAEVKIALDRHLGMGEEQLVTCDRAPAALGPLHHPTDGDADHGSDHGSRAISAPRVGSCGSRNRRARPNRVAAGRPDGARRVAEGTLGPTSHPSFGDESSVFLPKTLDFSQATMIGLSIAVIRGHAPADAHAAPHLERTSPWDCPAGSLAPVGSHSGRQHRL